MLYVWVDCSDVGGCTFRLKGENMGDFAAALPRLTDLHLGRSCHCDSWDIAIASPLSIFTQCLDLIVLETHSINLTCH